MPISDIGPYRVGYYLANQFAAKRRKRKYGQFFVVSANWMPLSWIKLTDVGFHRGIDID